jgi:hypothetical protein
MPGTSLSVLCYNQPATLRTVCCTRTDELHVTAPHVHSVPPLLHHRRWFVAAVAAMNDALHALGMNLTFQAPVSAGVWTVTDDAGNEHHFKVSSGQLTGRWGRRCPAGIVQCARGVQPFRCHGIDARQILACWNTVMLRAVGGSVHAVRATRLGCLEADMDGQCWAWLCPLGCCAGWFGDQGQQAGAHAAR